MSRLSQNDMEWLIEEVRSGKMSAAQANVEKVKMARVQVVSKLSADVRKALNNAVKAGELCHKKKDGRKPEVYYHPTFEHLANEARSQAEMEMLKALAGVVARPREELFY